MGYEMVTCPRGIHWKHCFFHQLGELSHAQSSNVFSSGRFPYRLINWVKTTTTKIYPIKTLYMCAWTHIHTQFLKFSLILMFQVTIGDNFWIAMLICLIMSIPLWKPVFVKQTFSGHRFLSLHIEATHKAWNSNPC